MNLLDFKRKAQGWHACGGDSDSGGSSSSNDSYGGMDTSYGGMDASGFGPTGDYGGDTSSSGGDSYGGFTQAEMDAAMGQMDAQATENEANNPGSYGGDASWTDILNPPISTVPTTPPNMSVAPGTPGVLNVTEVAQMAQDLGVPLSSMPQLSQDIGDMFGPSPVTGTNLSYADLQALEDAGLGHLDAHPGQTVSQALAAQATHAWLNQNIPTLFSFANPAAGAMVSALQQSLGLLSGKVSIGETVTGFAMQQVAQHFGVPIGVVTGIVNGNLGQAVSAATSGAIRGAVTQAIAEATGLPASFVSAGLGLTGMPGALSAGITSTVNNALGTTPSGQSNVSALAGAINSALGGGTFGGGTSTGGFGTGGSFGGGGGTGGSSGTGTGTSVPPTWDGIVRPIDPAAYAPPQTGPDMMDVLGLMSIMQPAQQQEQPVQAPVADIKSMKDLWGPGIDTNFLTTDVSQFSDGGTIEDLLHLLRR